MSTKNLLAVVILIAAIYLTFALVSLFHPF
jgi:hypothetical protein